MALFFCQIYYIIIEYYLVLCYGRGILWNLRDFVGIKKSVSKHSVSYSVIENVRDINGKSTTKVVEALGNEEQIRKKHPGVDPEEWAREYAKKLTEEKKKKSETIMIKYDPNKSIPKEKKRSFNIGYLFLKSIYHQLKLDT